MYRLNRRRTAVAAALVTACAGLTLGAAVAQDTHASSLSIRAAHHVVRPGGTDTISGTLHRSGGAALAGQVVTLEARPAGAGGFVPIGTDLSGPRGGVTLRVTPPESTRYRWAFAGSGAQRATHSATVTVVVRAPAHAAVRTGTSLSIRGRTAMTAADGSDVVSGQLRARHTPLRGRNVMLIARTGTSRTWTFVGVHRTSRTGRVGFTVHPTTSTAYRLQFLGTARLRGSHSGVLRVTARPTALTAVATPTSITAGGSATLSGVLTRSGAGFAGQSVQLRTRAAGTVIATTTSGPAGEVSFTVMPTRTTHYYLILPHTTGVPAARSRDVTVTVRGTTSLSIAGTRHPGGYRISGQLFTNTHRELARRTVTLQRLAPGTTAWTFVAAKKTGGHGRVSFWRAPAAGTQFRLVFAGGADHLGCTSSTITS